MNQDATRYAQLDDSNEDDFERRRHASFGYPPTATIYEDEVGDVAASANSPWLHGDFFEPGVTDPTTDMPMSPPLEDGQQEMQTFLPSHRQLKRASTVSFRSLDSNTTSSYNVETNDKYVKWGIGLQKPLLMYTLLFLGVATAYVHHYYYSRLKDTTAGDSSAQMWVLWIGTGATFITLFFLNAANSIAITQYLWVVVKRQVLTVDGLDSLFGLTDDLTGFFKVEMWKKAKLAMIVAFVFWCMALTGVIPPGTISVVQGGLQESPQTLYVPTFNWTSATTGGLLTFKKYLLISRTVAYPVTDILKIATTNAVTAELSQLIAPAYNSSFNQKFYGPALKCEYANSSQQTYFDYYSDAYYNSSNVVTARGLAKHGFRSTYTNLQFWSAWSPQLYGYISDNIPIKGEPDLYGNWQAMMTASGTTTDLSLSSSAQIWIQLANSSVVCTLTNASYDIDLSFQNGGQQINYNSVQHVNPWTHNARHIDFLGVMSALATMLYGNITMLPFQCDVTDIGAGECYMLSDTSSKLLLTGLTGCDEFQKSYWEDNVNLINSTHYNPAIVFPGNSDMCRNGSVLRAIEDLAQNITVSTLGLSVNTFKPLNESVRGTITSLENVYDYDRVKLIISYGVGILATLLLSIVGMLSFGVNGIAHDASFSSIMTTTRNPDLDSLAQGQSLGPQGRRLKETRLKFGSVEVAQRGGARGQMHPVRRAAFGLEKKVERLQRGGQYL